MVNPGLSHSCQQQLHNLGFKENIITATLLNVIYFGTLRINMNNFEDPLTFPLAPPADSNVRLILWLMSKCLQKDIPISLSCSLCLVMNS